MTNRAPCKALIMPAYARTPAYFVHTNSWTRKHPDALKKTLSA
jgi:hypothetical protein